MNHYWLQHSLCDVLQRCPGTKVCVRHELPVHWRIQGNPVQIKPDDNQGVSGREKGEAGRQTAAPPHIQNSNREHRV